MAENKSLSEIVPKINFLSTLTTLGKAADKAMDFSSANNKDVIKNIERKILKKSLKDIH